MGKGATFKDSMGNTRLKGRKNLISWSQRFRTAVKLVDNDFGPMLDGEKPSPSQTIPTDANMIREQLASSRGVDPGLVPLSDIQAEIEVIKAHNADVAQWAQLDSQLNAYIKMTLDDQLRAGYDAFDCGEDLYEQLKTDFGQVTTDHLDETFSKLLAITWKENGNAEKFMNRWNSHLSLYEQAFAPYILPQPIQVKLFVHALSHATSGCNWYQSFPHSIDISLTNIQSNFSYWISRSPNGNQTAVVTTKG